MSAGLSDSVGRPTVAVQEAVMASAAIHGVSPDLQTDFFWQAKEKRTIDVGVGVNL
jgi:hypothetical protein